MRDKRVVVGLFIFIAVLTPFALLSNSKQANALENSIINPAEENAKINQERKEYKNTLVLQENDYENVDGFYTKTIENGNYLNLYAYSIYDTDIVINEQNTLIKAQELAKFDISSEQNIQIKIPEENFENIKIGIQFNIPTTQVLESSIVSDGEIDGIEYEVEYNDNEALGRTYYLSLASEDNSMLRVKMNPDAIDQVYTDGIFYVDENELLFTNLTKEMTPQISFMLDTDEIDKVNYDVVSENFTVSSYKSKVKVQEINDEQMAELRKSGIDHGDAPESYGAGSVNTDNSAMLMNFYHLDDGFLIGSEIDKTPDKEVDSDSYSPSETALGDEDDELGYVTAIPGQGIEYTISPDTSNAYFYPRIRAKHEKVDLGIWIDYDGNGTFDADEGTILTDAPASKKGETLRYPIDLTPFLENDVTDTYMRIRLVSDNANMGLGDANADYSSKKYDGETEDHKVHINRDDYSSNVCYTTVVNDPAWNLTLKHNYGKKHKSFEVTNGPGKGSVVDIQSSGNWNVVGGGTGSVTEVSPDIKSNKIAVVESEEKLVQKENVVPSISFDENSNVRKQAIDGGFIFTVTDPNGQPLTEKFTIGVGDLDKKDTVTNISTPNVAKTEHSKLKEVSNGYKSEGNTEGDPSSYLWMTTTGNTNTVSFNVSSPYVIWDGLLKYESLPFKSHWNEEAVVQDCEGEIDSIEASKTYADEDGDNVIEISEDETFTINVTNPANVAQTVTVVDDLNNQEQDFSMIYDLTNPKSINVTVTGGTLITQNPTLEDLMSDGIKIKVPAGETVTVSFTLTTNSDIPLDLNADGIKDEEVTNVATVSSLASAKLNPSVTVPIIREINDRAIEGK